MPSVWRVLDQLDHEFLLSLESPWNVDIYFLGGSSSFIKHVLIMYVVCSLLLPLLRKEVNCD